MVMALRKKVSSAMIYPAILLNLAIAFVVLLVTFILPNFQDFFRDMGSELPLIARAVLGVSSLVVNNAVILSLAVIGGGVAIVLYLRRRVERVRSRP